jgi:eukaryotic translation initiation factor 2C
MAGPSKLRNHKEEKKQQKQQREEARSADNSSGSRPTERSIDKFDGNRDPDGHGRGVMEYTRLNDLKNLSEFLGFAGWCAARGVSANAPVPHPAYACRQTNGSHASAYPGTNHWSCEMLLHSI